MFDVLLSGPYVPFALALGILAGLLLIELVAVLTGGSLMSNDVAADAIGAADATFDLPAGAEPDVAALVSASETLSADAPSAGDSAGPLALLGLGRVPFAIWLAAALTGFGVTGVALQSIATKITGAPIAAVLAMVPAVLAGVACARVFGRVLSGLLPQVETTATSAQFMGGLRGVVTQGTAREGFPAEVRLRDRHGNTHYVRCEPFRAEDVVHEGTEVLLLRQRAPGGWSLRIVPLPAV